MREPELIKDLQYFKDKVAELYKMGIYSKSDLLMEAKDRFHAHQLNEVKEQLAAKGKEVKKLTDYIKVLKSDVLVEESKVKHLTNDLNELREYSKKATLDLIAETEKTKTLPENCIDGHIQTSKCIYKESCKHCSTH